jgi:uncharacterized protein (TIGR02145 family)
MSVDDLLKALKNEELSIHVIENIFQKSKYYSFPIYSLVQLIKAQILVNKKSNLNTSIEGWIVSEFEINSKTKIEDFIFIPAFKGNLTKSELKELYHAASISGIPTNEIDKILLQITEFKKSVALTIKEIISGNSIAPDISNYETFTDPRDNKNYKIKKIGNQTWFAENLAWMPSVSPSIKGSDHKPYYFVYGYEGTNVIDAKLTYNFKTYGVLYNWPAAKIACPPGWHLPSDSEWKKLIEHVESSGVLYRKLKSNKLWWSDNRIEIDRGSNNCGFSALPGGGRGTNNSFGDVRIYCNFWSATEINLITAIFYYLAFDEEHLSKGKIDKEYGFSIRCIKD